MLFLALGSSYVQDKAGFIPRPAREWDMWQGLTDLRVSLLERGMLNEALTLFKVERTRLPPMERPDAVREVLEYIQAHFLLSEERSAWVEAELAIYLGQSLYEIQEGDQGAIEFQRADNLLDYWCSLCENQEKDTLTPTLDLKLLKFRYGDFDNEPLLYYTESTKLLEVFKSCCHTSTTVCYGLAIESARQLMTNDETDPYRATFYDILGKLQEYQENVLEDIHGMLNGQSPLFAEASGYNPMDANKVLEWLDGFERKHPAFNIPGGMMLICTRRRMIHVLRRDTEKQVQEEVKMEKLKGKVPAQIGALVATRKPKTVPISSTGNIKAKVIIPINIDEDNFFMPWVNIAGNPKETRAQALKLLVQWMLSDLTSGVMKESEARALLGTRSGDEEDISIVNKIKALTSDTAFSSLYLSSGESLETVIDIEQWAKKFETLKSWLSRSSKPTMNGRQYLRVVLQEARKDSVIDYKAPLDVRILEINRCISMVETLTPRVKEVVSSKVILWSGSIADQQFLYCIESSNFDSEEIGEYLTRSVDIGLKIIEEFQKLRDLTQVAARQRMTGEVCLFSLNWMLRRPGQTILDPDLLKLQQVGLDCLEKADKFYAPLLQEVTWCHGLESVQERERSISTSVSWRIPQLAVRLLVAGGVPVDESKRKAIWTWVQRSKARALAMAMGTTGRVPAALLQQIMAHDHYRLLYEKMLSLQQQMQALEPHRRFAIRKEMDIHIQEMRKHKPLAELSDIKDGKALSLSDLDTIMAASNTSAVLVDWFYVCLDVMDEGSILLLTAKVGFTPTISVLATEPQKVTNWISSNLDGDFSTYTAKETTGLVHLVQPLIDATKPDETLIFCPSGNLHRIPLHSIDFLQDPQEDLWQPLIYRNPIVYTHSHSVLRMCLWNAQAAAEAKAPLSPLVMNGIPDDSAIPNNVERAAGRASVQELAAFFGVNPQLNSSGTKANFLARAPSSRFIHIHSHVEWADANPLAHSICFAPPSSSDSSCSAVADTKFSAREAFTLSLPRGTHVSLIACSGGLSRISPEDEVMGLIPALLYAGASSTITTLWPILDQAGAGFTKAFCGKFEEAKKEGLARSEGVIVDGCWVDVAKVFREVVIERDGEEMRSGMVHWTAFVMHGFWRLWVPLR